MEKTLFKQYYAVYLVPLVFWMAKNRHLAMVVVQSFGLCLCGWQGGGAAANDKDEGTRGEPG